VIGVSLPIPFIEDQPIMFTGIVQAVGQLARKELLGTDARLLVHAPSVFALKTVQLGDSIAVNGVCLTVIQRLERGFWADVSAETLACTTFNELALNSPVNLEKALTPQTPLGGHIVNGHVDGVGLVTQAYHDGRSLRLTLQAPHALAKYIAPKGSITLDGISLTVNRVAANEFSLNIVPHTLEVTTLKQLKVGQKMNLEVDIIARYLERLLAEQQGGSELSHAFLKRHGFAS